MEYNVYMTNDCNLMCQYCSVLLDCEKNHLPGKPAYELSKLVTFIRKTQEQQNDREIVIFFFGGEPTLEYERMQEYAECFQRELKEYDLKLVLHTNGLLLHQIPDSLLQSLSLIMYSINYEKVPHYNLKDSYFSTIMDHVLEVKKKTDIPVVARLTITEKTSLYTELSQVTPFFDMCYWQIENVDQFENYEQFYKTYTYEVKLAFEAWMKRLRTGELLLYIPFMAVLKFTYYHDRDDQQFLCGYDNHMVYVQTDGKCYACCDSMESGQHYIGDIEKGIQFHGYRLKEFLCGDCEDRSVCMGRCGRMHVEHDRDNRGHIEEYCNMNQYMFRLFREHHEEIAGLLKQYPYYEQQLSGWQLDIMEYTP